MKVKFFTVMFLLVAFLFGGKYADAFLDLGVSARSLAMGNSTGAIDTTGTAFVFNPAGIAYVRNFDLNCMYTVNFGMASTSYIGIVKGVKGGVGFGISWIRFSVEDIPIRPDIFRLVSGEKERRDTVRVISRLPLNTFDDFEDAFFISVGRKFVRYVDFGWRYAKVRVEIPVGLNVKLVRKRLYYLTGNGIGIDLGFRLRMRGKDLFEIRNIGDLVIGFTYRNIGGCTIYWSSRKQDCVEMDRLFSLGFFQPVRRFDSVVVISLQKSQVYNEMTGGIEFGIKRAIYFRAGYSDVGLLLGVGLNFRKFGFLVSIDYALYMHEDLTAAHRVGGGVKF
ncbi:MAG: hypothetical protein DRP88_08855 [Candidatus Neomarinimicrobiota bacterium]|nr:MAG: hypothetical protein DRP88_08855 [Candidatus Neomarinimicrobiota bacterium]